MTEAWQSSCEGVKAAKLCQKEGNWFGRKCDRRANGGVVAAKYSGKQSNWLVLTRSWLHWVADCGPRVELGWYVLG